MVNIWCRNRKLTDLGMRSRKLLALLPLIERTDMRPSGSYTAGSYATWRDFRRHIPSRQLRVGRRCSQRSPGPEFYSPGRIAAPHDARYVCADLIEARDWRPGRVEHSGVLVGLQLDKGTEAVGDSLHCVEWSAVDRGHAWVGVCLLSRPLAIVRVLPRPNAGSSPLRACRLCSAIVCATPFGSTPQASPTRRSFDPL